MSWLSCRNGCGRPRSATVVSSDGHHIPECRSCGDGAYIENFDIEYGKRWDDVWGYITTEYDIDANADRVVLHLERDGYFTGYYFGTDILTDEEKPMYRMVLDRMVADLEEVPPREFSIERN